MELTAIVLGPEMDKYYDILSKGDIMCINRNSAFKEIIMKLYEDEYSTSVIRIMFVADGNEKFTNVVIKRSNVCIYPISRESLEDAKEIIKEMKGQFNDITKEDTIPLQLICPVIGIKDEERRKEKESNDVPVQEDKTLISGMPISRSTKFIDSITEKMDKLYYYIPQLVGVMDVSDYDTLRVFALEASKFDLIEFYEAFDEDGGMGDNENLNRNDNKNITGLSATGENIIRFLWKLNINKMKEILEVTEIHECIDKVSKMRIQPYRTIIRGIISSNFDPNYIPKQEIFTNYLNLSYPRKDLENGLYIQPSELYKEKLMMKLSDATEMEMTKEHNEKIDLREEGTIKMLLLQVFNTTPLIPLTVLIDNVPISHDYINNNENDEDKTNESDTRSINIQNIVEYCSNLFLFSPTLMLTTVASVMEGNVTDEIPRAFITIPRTWLPESDHERERDSFVLYNTTNLTYPPINHFGQYKFIIKPLHESISELLIIHPSPDFLLVDPKSAEGVLSLANAMGIVVVVVSEDSRDKLKLETGIPVVSPNIDAMTRSLATFVRYHIFNGVLGQQQLLLDIMQKKKASSKNTGNNNGNDNYDMYRDKDTDDSGVVSRNNPSYKKLKRNKSIIIFGVAMIGMGLLSIGNIVSGMRKRENNARPK